MSDLSELVERVSQRPPSWDLFKEVFRAIDDESINEPQFDRFLMAEAWVEAALMLLPDYASFELMRSAAGPPTFTRCRLWDWHRSPPAADPGNDWKVEGNRPLGNNICLAALKIRASAVIPLRARLSPAPRREG